MKKVLFCCILNNVSFDVNPVPQGRTEATFIVSDWVSKVKEEIKKEEATRFKLQYCSVGLG